MRWGYTASLNTDTSGMKEERAGSFFLFSHSHCKPVCCRELGTAEIKTVLHYRKTNPVTSRLGKEIRVGEKGDLIPPACLVPTPTSYVFGEASHTGYDPLTTVLQPWKEPFSLDALLVSNGQDAGREKGREGAKQGGKEGGMFSEEQEGSWLPSQLCGWQWAKRSLFSSPSIKGAIKKKCAILKVQKKNPNHNHLQIILIWTLRKSIMKRGNSNFLLLLLDQVSLFLFFLRLVSMERHCLVPCSLEAWLGLGTSPQQGGKHRAFSSPFSSENDGQDRSSWSVRSLGPPGKCQHQAKLH